MIKIRNLIKKYFRRFCSVFLCFAIFFVFCLIPANATTVVESPLFDVLSIQERESFVYSFTNNYTAQFKLPRFDFIYYVEVLFYSWEDVSINLKYANSSVPLTKISLGNNYYRAYYSGYAYGSSLNLDFNVDGSSNVYVLSLSYSSIPLNNTPLPYSISYINYPGSLYNSNVSAGSTFRIPAASDPESHQNLGAPFDFTIYVAASDWKKYDYLNLRFDLYSTSLNSCITRIGSVVLPSSISLSDNVFDFDVLFPDDQLTTSVPSNHYTLVIDLSSVDRSSTESLAIQVTGTYGFGFGFYDYFGTIYFLNGYFRLNEIEADIVWYKKIYLAIMNGFNNSLEWLTVISSKLDIVIGGDPAVSDVRQTQEEINVSVNNQLVGAVEDWNTNIEVVETGYDMAFSKTTPALVWVASLADGIFNGMGWFGNVYFLVGLISVIMLVLSKSGLAHKIGSISRRKGD